jgi:hypothetical protein
MKPRLRLRLFFLQDNLRNGGIENQLDVPALLPRVRTKDFRRSREA